VRSRGRVFASAQTHRRIRTDAHCFIPGNFKKDATVRPSHGRPRGHRLTVRTSENVRVTTLRMSPWGILLKTSIKLIFHIFSKELLHAAMWLKLPKG
jgi:hypothetical protein